MSRVKRLLSVKERISKVHLSLRLLILTKILRTAILKVSLSDQVKKDQIVKVQEGQLQLQKKSQGMLLSPKEVDLHQRKAKKPQARKRDLKEKVLRRMPSTKNQRKTRVKESKKKLRD